MSYCSRCGMHLDSMMRFCPRCGNAAQTAEYKSSQISEDAIYNMKKRAIHYYNIENYTQAYEYCEDVLDIIPDDELMNELKLDILLAQSNEALRRANRLLENYPYKEVSDEVSSLIAKAEKISPNNKNIAVIQDKCKDKLISEVADYVCKRLEERDYESANEVAEHLMRSWKGDPRAEMLYKFVKEHSPRRWRR